MRDPAPIGQPMPKLLGLQYLRAIAATLVVLFHAAVNTKLPFGFGTFGVDLFFVLSGFLMWAITDADSRPHSFLADRIRRIVPAYWVATLTVFIGVSLGLFHNTKGGIAHLVGSLFFIPHFSPTNGKLYPLLLPGWTLNYEMFFYALFALTLILSRRWQPVLISLIFLGLVALGHLAGPSDALGRFYTDAIMLEFALGMWLGILWKQGWRPPIGIWALAGIAGLSFVAAYLAGTGSLRILRFGLPALIIVAAVLFIETKRPLPHWRWLELLGDASYSIYLWHSLFIAAALKCLVFFGTPQALSFVVAVIVGLAGGLAAYWLIEKPILELFKSLKRKKRGLAHVVSTPGA